MRSLTRLYVVVVAVEDLARVAQVEVVLARLRPRQRGEPFQVGADHPVLGRLRRQVLEARELALGLLPGLVGELRLLELAAQLLSLDLLLVVLAELVLDGLQLLAQEPFALALVHLRLHLGLDARPDLHQFELAGQDLREHAQPLGHVALLEQGLLLLGLDAQRAGDQVRELGRIVEVGHRHQQLLGQIGQLLDDAREGALHVAMERLQLRGGTDDVGGFLEARDEVRLRGDELLEVHPLRAVHEDAQRSVGHLEHARHHAGDSHAIQVVRAGLLGLGVLGGDHHQHAAAGQHVVDQRHGALLPDGQRRECLRERDGLAQRQHGQGLRHAGAHLGGHHLPLAGGDVDAHPSSIGTRRTPCSSRASGISTSRIPSS